MDNSSSSELDADAAMEIDDDGEPAMVESKKITLNKQKTCSRSTDIFF